MKPHILAEDAAYKSRNDICPDRRSHAMDPWFDQQDLGLNHIEPAKHDCIQHMSF